MQKFKRKVSRTLGFALIIIGMFPLIFGLVGSSTTCQLNGCPPNVISRLYWQSAILFFSGIALVTIGIISVFFTATYETSARVLCGYFTGPGASMNPE